MRNQIAFVVALLFCSSLLAQQGKVLQVRGSRAVVEFPIGTSLIQGGAVSLGGGGSSMPGAGNSAGAALGSREHTLAISASILSASQSGGGNSSTIGALFKYGWNAVKMEYGPQVSVQTSSVGSQTTLAAGGFFDYNFVPNVPGQLSVYGLGATLDTGTVTASGTSSANTVLFFGGNFKWFPLGNTVALRTDVGVAYKPAAGVVPAETGLAVRLAMQVYY